MMHFMTATLVLRDKSFVHDKSRIFLLNHTIATSPFFLLFPYQLNSYVKMNVRWYYDTVYPINVQKVSVWGQGIKGEDWHNIRQSSFYLYR